jgi:hypothetical protein
MIITNVVHVCHGKVDICKCIKFGSDYCNRLIDGVGECHLDINDVDSLDVTQFENAIYFWEVNLN